MHICIHICIKQQLIKEKPSIWKGGMVVLGGKKGRGEMKQLYYDLETEI